MKAIILALAIGASAVAQVVPNRAPLQPKAFDPLPLTSIKPKGWLLQQLRIQAGGLSGHLDEFWPWVGPNSGWRGGTGESWELGPYYMDGLVPLAFLLEDEKLIAKARAWVGWTLENQRPDGAIGPPKNKDWWPNIVMLKVLSQYAEATGDKRVVPLMDRYLAYHNENAAARTLDEWAVYRWGDEIVSLIWTYNRTGNPRLLELAGKLHEQGYDWKAHFADFRFRGKVRKEEMSLATHVVNNAMALKTSAVWWQISGSRSDRDAIYQLLREMDRYHLLPNGVHSGDEHYAGNNPTQGTELCAVVEAMFSYEQLVAILGDPVMADRLERVAYNALPATFSGDMWAHQYDQQPNQVLCSRHRRDWTNNGRDANLFGLEPHYRCCTANFNQGWPKLAASLWMAVPGGGLAAVVYAPNEVRAEVNGIPVTVVEETEYPFRGEVRLAVNPERPAEFPLLLRIPGWAEGATVTVNGKASPNARPGTFHRIRRRWAKGDRVELSFPMRVRTSRWFRNSVAVERGPLVFALKVGEDWRKLRDIGPAADWEVHPTTPWNYGLIAGAKPEVVEKPVGKMPFSPEGAPVEIRIQGRRIPEWVLVNGSAGPLPESPAESREPVEVLTLAPYGSVKLRITAFPELKR